jgi:hypothetical protein
VKSRHVWYAGLILLVLLAVGIRLRLLALPLERDEGEFAYEGQLILQGIAPYKLAFNMKMPGIYAAYAGLMAIFGETPSGIHLGFLVVNLATLVLLFFLARRLLEPAAVPVCCAAYVLLSLSPTVLGLEGHATNCVVLFALAGLLLLFRARPQGHLLLVFLAGVCFGLAFMSKQPGLYFGFFGVLLLAYDTLAIRPIPWIKGLLNLVCLGAGMAVPLALTCLILWRAGTFDRFWFWTFEYAKVYGGLQSLPEGFDRLREFFMDGFDRWFYLTGAVGLVAMFLRKAGRERQFFFAALFFCSFLATAAGLYFRGHYFILTLPVTCLLIGDFFAWAFDALSRNANQSLRAIPTALFVAASVALVWEHRAVWFELPMPQACKEMYLAEGFVECEVIGNYIRTHSSPEDRVVVLGSDPEVYFYAHRHSVSGYIYMYDLVRPQPHGVAMRQEFMEDVEKAKPRFLVLVNVGTSWMPWQPDVKPFTDWINDYPRKHYDLLGLAEVDQTNSAFFWDPDSISKHLSTPTDILLFRRSAETNR